MIWSIFDNDDWSIFDNEEIWWDLFSWTIFKHFYKSDLAESVWGEDINETDLDDPTTSRILQQKLL